MAQSLAAGGVPLEGLAAELKSGRLSLDFLDDPVFETFAALSTVTFEELSAQTGVPVELLMVIREAIGSALPVPSDLVRENELTVVGMLEAKLRVGYPAEVVEASLRTMGDSLRRLALTEADAFRAHVIWPITHRPGVEIAAAAGAAAGQLHQGSMRRSSRSTTPRRSRDGPRTSSTVSSRHLRMPVCSVASSILRPCAFWISPGTHASPRNAAMPPPRIWHRSWPDSSSARQCAMAGDRSNGLATA